MEFCHSFIASIEMILWGFFSPFILLLTYHIDQFLSVDSFSNSRNKSHLVIVYKPFNVLLRFVHILFKISMSVFIKHICHFLVVSLPVFGISVKVFKIYAGCKFHFRSVICKYSLPVYDAFSVSSRCHLKHKVVFKILGFFGCAAWLTGS